MDFDIGRSGAKFFKDVGFSGASKCVPLAAGAVAVRIERIERIEQIECLLIFWAGHAEIHRLA